MILATAEDCGTLEIVRRSGLSKPVVWRQERFMHEGVDGLLRDKTRPPGKRPLPGETVRRVVNLMLAAPPGETTHWTGRALAAAAGDGARRVRIDTQAQKLIAVPRSISQESTRLAATPTAAGTGMLKPKAETLP